MSLQYKGIDLTLSGLRKHWHELGIETDPSNKIGWKMTRERAVYFTSLGRDETACFSSATYSNEPSRSRERHSNVY